MVFLLCVCKMSSPSKKQDPNAGPEQTRPGQQLLPGYVVKLLKSLKISHGTDRTMNGVDVDPTIGIISHIIDCLGYFNGLIYLFISSLTHSQAHCVTLTKYTELKVVCRPDPLVQEVCLDSPLN